jgi:hypothetical protein
MIETRVQKNNKGRSPNGKLSDFSFYIDSQNSAHRKFKKYISKNWEFFIEIDFFCVSKLSIDIFFKLPVNRYLAINIEGKIGQLTVIRTSSFISNMTEMISVIITKNY